MGWQQNLLSNLLSFTIIGSLILLVYCRIAKKTLSELIIDIREAMATPIEE